MAVTAPSPSGVRATEELHRSASGLWVQDNYGDVRAFDDKGNLLWQRQVVAEDTPNATGTQADFVSVKKSWVSNNGAPGGIDTLMLTGLASDGTVLWQQSFSGPIPSNYYTAAWKYAQDDQGQVCFNNMVESPQLIQCVNPNGTSGSHYVVSSVDIYKRIDLSNQRLAVVGVCQQNASVNKYRVV